MEHEIEAAIELGYRVWGLIMENGKRRAWTPAVDTVDPDLYNPSFQYVFRCFSI